MVSQKRYYFLEKRALRILIEDENNNLPCFGVSVFGLSALSFFIDNVPSSSTNHPSNHTSSLVISCVLVLLGTACLDLKRYDECLSYSNWANRNLTRLLDQHSLSPGTAILQCLLSTQRLLAHVKEATGRKDEVVVHLIRILEVKEKLVEEGCIELGEANYHVCDAYLSVGNSKEALPFCLKALEICEKHFGRDSGEVDQMMRTLAFIYNDLGEYEKVLEHNQISQSVLKNMSPDYVDLLKAENCNLLIKLGRYEEAVNVFDGLVSDAATEGGRASACVCLAKAFVHLEKLSDAKKHLKTARKVLEKKEIDPFIVATSFNDMSNLYAMMNDCETAISMLRRALTVPELPQRFLPNGSKRLFSLILRTGKVKEGIRYLEDVVKILKKKFGPEHSEVGYGYKHLGLAYFCLGQYELAAKILANAKDVMDASLGPHHLESVRTSQDLSLSYFNMCRYDLAIDTQEQVIDGLKGLGPSEQECLDKAVGMLNQMKKCAAESPAMVSSQSKDVEDLCETISKCGISDDHD